MITSMEELFFYGVISIIVPVWNARELLRDCLNSICAQTFTDWELIAVDCGTIDGSGKVLDKYVSLDKRITVIHQQMLAFLKNGNSIMLAPWCKLYKKEVVGICVLCSLIIFKRFEVKLSLCILNYKGV